MTSRDILIGLAIKFKGDWEKIYNFVHTHEPFDEEELKSLIKRCNSKAITILDDAYPETLKTIYRPPFVLFYHGNINLLDCKFKSISVVGSRKCTYHGAMDTVELVKELSKHLIVISGMAMGIDSIAHWTALRNGGKTIAVLGSGINYVYPTFNSTLYNKIKNEGLIISEYPDDTPPTPKTFPIRNRIVAGLTNCVLVPEAKNNSGTSITVGLEISEGGYVCVCPDYRGNNSLCNHLIQSGARLVETVEDIYDEMNFKIPKPVFK